MKYILYDPLTGEIDRTGNCPAADFALQAEPGFAVLEGSGSGATHYVFQGALTPYDSNIAAAKAARPSYPATWSNDTMSWSDARGLPQLRADKWNEVKAACDAAINAPLDTPVGAVDHDAASRATLFRLAQRAKELVATGKPADVEFTMADNSTVTISAVNMVKLWLLSDDREQTALKRARTLRGQIAAALTAAVVAAIVW